MRRNLLFGFICGTLCAAGSPAQAGVTLSGDVVTNSEYGIILGLTSGGASLTVNGGSIFSFVPGQPAGLFGVGVGANSFNGSSTTANNGVFISGAGSQLVCGGFGGEGGMYIGGVNAAASGNELIISDGGGLTSTVNLGGLENSALVTGPGSYINGSTNTNGRIGYYGVTGFSGVGTSGSGGTFTVQNGAQIEAALTVSGSNNFILVSGSNTVWNANPLAYPSVTFPTGWSNSFTLNNGAQMNCSGIATGSDANDSILVDGSGSILNCVGIDLTGTNDCFFKVSGGATVNVNLPGYPGNHFWLQGSGDEATVTGSGTMLTIGSPVDSFNNPPLALLGQSEPGQAPNTLIISNGARVVAWGDIAVGMLEFLQPQGETLIVTGAGSQLIAPSGNLFVGTELYEPDIAGRFPMNNQLLVGQGATVAAGNVSIQTQSSATVTGSLYVTNATGSGQLTLGGLLTLSGLVVADSVVFQSLGSYEFGVFQTLAGAPMVFASGTLKTKGLTGSTGQPFVVGDGTNAANYLMDGGAHVFGNGLVVSSNSVLSGCGTVTGSVTNYGLIILTNGCDMNFSGPVINYGTILALNGTANFLATIVNHGALFQNTALVTGLSFNGADILVQFNTVANYPLDVQAINNLASGAWASLTNGLLGTGGPMTIRDFGGATNAQRFYRVLLNY